MKKHGVARGVSARKIALSPFAFESKFFISHLVTAQKTSRILTGAGRCCFLRFGKNA